ncbi:MAG: hypothetical protein ACXIVE_10505, partial [Salinarimonas sp.]
MSVCRFIEFASSRRLNSKAVHLCVSCFFELQTSIDPWVIDLTGPLHPNAANEKPPPSVPDGGFST